MPLMIAYVASFGVDYPEYTQEESTRLGTLLSKFDIVSTREKQGIYIIKNVYGWNVETLVTLINDCRQDSI